MIYKDNCDEKSRICLNESIVLMVIIIIMIIMAMIITIVIILIMLLIATAEISPSFCIEES